MSVANLQNMLNEKKARLSSMESNARGPSHELQNRDLDRLVDELPPYYRESARLWPKSQVIETIIKRRFPELTELRDEVKRLEKRIADIKANPGSSVDIYRSTYGW